MNINLRKIFKKYKIIIVFSVIVGISSIYFLLNKENFKEGMLSTEASKDGTSNQQQAIINYAYFYEPSEKNSSGAEGVLGNVDGTIPNSDDNNLQLFNKKLVINYGTVQGQTETHKKIIWEAATIKTNFQNYEKFKKIKGGDWRNDVIFNNNVKSDNLTNEFNEFESLIEKEVLTNNSNLYKLPNKYGNITFDVLKQKYQDGEINEKTKIIIVDTNNDYQKSSPIPLDFLVNDGKNAVYDEIKKETIEHRNTKESKYYWYKKKNKIIGPLTKNDLIKHFRTKKLHEHHIVYRSIGDSKKLTKIDKDNGKRLREIGMQYLTSNETTTDSELVERDGKDGLRTYFDKTKNANNNLYSELNDKVDEKRKETSWMYDDSNKHDTITDLNHPYFGSYKNVKKSDCLDDKGNCKTGLYKHGEKCLFEENSWGFEDKNICYPLSCKDDYNPNKRCKVPYKNRDIPKCFNDFKCDSRGTMLKDPNAPGGLTAESYLRELIGMKDPQYNEQWKKWYKTNGAYYIRYIKNNSPYKEKLAESGKFNNYSKKFLVDGKSTNFDRDYVKNKTNCKCECKKDDEGNDLWYGNDCSIPLTKENRCDGATDASSCLIPKPNSEIFTLEPAPLLVIYITIGIVAVMTLGSLAYFGVFDKMFQQAKMIKNNLQAVDKKPLIIAGCIFLALVVGYLLKTYVLNN